MAKRPIKEPEKKYEVIRSSNINDVEKGVNALIERGYKPWGNLVVAAGIQRTGNPNTEQLFIQPMYKE